MPNHRIQSRDERLREYNLAHPERITDPEKRIRRYFSDNGLNLEKAIAKAKKKALRIIDQREYESIRILMYEYPKGTPRPRVYRGHAFSPGASENKRYLMDAMRAINKTINLIVTPYEVEMDLYLEMPKKVPPDEIILFEAKMIPAPEKPDWDNAAKTYTDMLIDVITLDDDLIWRGEVRKWYSLQPRIDIRITYVKTIESDFIYKRLKGRKAIKEGIKNGTIRLRHME